MDVTTVRCQHIIDGKECGTFLQWGSSSCLTCKGEVDPTIWENEPMHVCGAPLEDGSLCDWEVTPGCKFKFCPECGTKLGTGQKQPKKITTCKTEQQFPQQPPAVQDAPTPSPSVKAMELPTNKGSHQYGGVQGAACYTAEPVAMSQPPTYPGSYGTAPAGSWTQSPTQPGSYGAAPAGSWTQSPAQPGYYGAAPAGSLTQSPAQPGSYGATPAGSWTQSPAQPGSYDAAPAGSWTQSPTQPASYGAAPAGSWTQSPAQPGSYGAAPAGSWTQSPAQPGSYGATPAGSLTQSPAQPGSYGAAPAGSWTRSPAQPGSYGATPAGSLTQSPSSYGATPTVMSPQSTALTSDPLIHSQMPQSPMQPRYFNEAPAMKVAQTMKGLPGVLLSVRPVMHRKEDDNNFPTSPNHKTQVPHAPLSGIEQEHLSSHNIGHAAIKGQCLSPMLDHPDAIRNLPEHLQKEVLHLAKSIKVPAVKEVAQCSAEEKHLKSCTQDLHVEMGKDSTSDSDEVQLENEQTESSNKPELAIEKKGKQVEKNLTQSEKENTQNDCSEPDNGTNKVGHKTGDVNGNITNGKGDKPRNAAEAGKAIQDNSKVSEEGQQEQLELSKPLDKDHPEPSMPLDKNHSEPSTPPDKDHSEPSTPLDKDLSEPSTPLDKDHSEPSTPLDKDHSEPSTPHDKDHSTQRLNGTEKMSSGSEGIREDKNARQKTATSGGGSGDDKTQTETAANQGSAEQGGDKETSRQQNNQQDNRRDHMKVINKKKTKEENLVDPSARSRPQRKEEKQNLEKVTVHFHVVVSHDFKLDETDLVIVRFDSKWPEGGGWECKKHRLRQERKLAGGHLLFSISTEIPKQHLIGSPGLKYKYAILKSGRKGEQIWEYLDKRNYFLKKSGDNRILHVPLERLKALKGEVCHQYGGMINKGDTGMIATLKNWWEKTKDQRRREMAIATHAFLPKLDSICIDTNLASAEQALKQIVHIRNCMTLCDDTANILLEYLMPYIEQLGQTRTGRSEEPTSDSIARLSTAMVVIYIISTCGVSIEREMAIVLCEALLLRTPGEDHICHDFEAVSQHFPEYKIDLTVALVKFLDMCIIKFCLDQWLFAVPLCHFLRDCSKPYQSVYDQQKADHTYSRWWGVQHLKPLVDKYKSKTMDRKIDVDLLLRRLEPLFAVDQLLQRTLMAAMSVEHIEPMIKSQKIAPEVCMANLTFFLKGNQIPAHELKKKTAVCIEPIILSIQELQNGLPNEREVLEKHAHIITLISLDFLDAALNKLTGTSSYETLGSVVSTVAASIATLYKVAQGDSTQQENKDLLNVIERVFNTAIEKVDYWLRIKLPLHLLDFYKKLTDVFELEVWSHLLNIEFGSEKYTDQWHQHLLHWLKLRIEKSNTDGRLEFYCYTDFARYNPRVEELFSKCAFEALNDSSTTHALLSHAYSNQGNKIRWLLSRMLSVNWPKNQATDRPSEDPSVILKHVLSWPSFVRCLELTYKYSTNPVFDQQCSRIINDAINCLMTSVEDLMAGQTRIVTLKLITAHKHDLREICAMMVKEKKQLPVPEPKGGEASPIAVLLKVLEWRESEMQSIEDEKKVIMNMLGMVNKIDSVDSDHLQKQLRSINDDMLLNQLCNPYQYTAKTATHMGKITAELTYFNLSDSVKDILHTLSTSLIIDSQLFDTLWKRTGKTVCHRRQAEESDRLSLDDVVKEVWLPVKKHYDDLCTRIQNGSVTLLEVDKFLNAYVDNYPDLKHEFQLMSASDKTWINQRVHQVQQYHELDQCRHGAELIKAAKDVFQLTGDFRVLEVILTAVKDKKLCLLRSITDDVVSAKKHLVGVTPDKVESLRILTKCKALIDWLKKNIKDVKELNVLAELAMSSAAGQGDLEVERVLCLLAAVNGYAPFIYDLPKDAGFKHFMKLCDHIWHALANDRNLPKKLQDTCRHLDWLKNVKESHGSVEVNAISQAKAINARGIYHVGKQKDLEPESPETVVRLVLPPETKSGETKNYTFQQLQDLQSKLMLVAGKAEKGKDDVDTFTEVLDGVTRLANIYIKICTSGSILFRDWLSTFYCEPKRPVNAVIDFGLSKQMLHGLSTHCRTVALQIRAMCDFFDECYSDWLHHIAVQREQFCYLNHYTTQQVVILCKKIAAFCFSGDRNVDPLVYPMLCAVRPNCTVDDLGKAVKSAFQDLADRQKHANRGGADTDDCLSAIAMEDAESEDTDEKMRQEFIDAMLDGDYPIELARRALHEMQSIDIDEGLVWCMDHMGDALDNEGNENVEETDDSLSSENDTRTPNELLNVTESFETVMGEQLHRLRHTDSLEAKLKDLWTSHLESAATSVTDYLSVEHLGSILEELTVLTEINRPMPQQLVKGNPNLIVCPQADVLRAVLSVYLCDGGRDLPLPGIDEVLLCTEHTTSEEVDLLYRRAAKDRQGKIYCLANADMLDYEVSEKAESYLEKHIKGNQVSLVVICGKEREDRSQLVTALDKHRINTPIIASVKDVQAYLKQHFHINSDQQNTLHVAAEVDPEHCTVRVVKSERAGVGKSLHVKRLTEKLTALNGAALYRRCKSLACVTVTLQQKTVDHSNVLATLVKHITMPDRPVPCVFHFDIAHETYEGVDNLLFNLLVLGTLTDQTGLVWRRSMMDLYVIETLPLLWHGPTTQPSVAGPQGEQTEYVHRILAMLPSLTCRSPQQSIDALTQPGSPSLLFNDWTDHDQLMDDKEFRSEIFQRPYQYLTRFSTGQCLNSVAPQIIEGTPAECLQCLLRYCGIPDPSWAELRHFVWFLNVQLCDSENSNFCSLHVQNDLPGFVRFVVHFMIQMSKDFATRSLNVSEETPGLVVQRAEQEFPEEDEEEELDDQAGQAVMVPFQLRRHWETSPHPYLFFNSDHHSMTFLGFYIDPASGNLLDPRTNDLLERQVMLRPLQDALRRNMVQLNENFDVLARSIKIHRLCSVMGIEDICDPDEEYELTTDNVKKILAIHMRLRCGIPVVIMGETGCGKTRLIKFMCDLWKPPGTDDMQNMVLVKVHGGTTEGDIIRKVNQASELARVNRQNIPPVDTVLFFDEANTTEAIGLIKEIMCDKRMKGKSLPYTDGLKVIAACNPYRKHSDEMIQRLEQAGLGYRVQARDTKDKLGYIPMRQLVYRVQALPQSILPLVWDFGQLTIEVEQLYIKQMVHRCIKDEVLPNVLGLHEVASDILATSQAFMRDQQEECSFVSLRDVKRVLDVMTWFYKQRDLLFHLMDELAEKEIEQTTMNVDDDDDELEYERLDDVTRSLVLALGVCYHACLQNREAYRDCVATHFTGNLSLPNGARTILDEIIRCEDVFLDCVQLEPNIARNQALKENIFMMIVCIELRIPLFLVGKPGSSKSLARTIVADAMQGRRAHSDLFKQFKEAYMISFQCSPLSTPEGIVGTFRQCSQLQKDKDLTQFVAVVVLDEVGLAEDSPSMPLKALHPLLEDGCEGDEVTAPHKKVAFIGISNWALDPAKMNRGILVQRGIPDELELQNSAKGICSTDEIVQQRISRFVLPLAKAYLEMYNSALDIREFFGLRDFYSLIKMVSAFSKKSRLKPTWPEMVHAIKRNFGGLDCVDPVAVFERNIPNVDKERGRQATDPPCDAAGLIRSSLHREMPQDLNNENRYLLILTENYAALSILPQLLDMKETITIFGSSFPKDQEYTQVCRNINRIKVCMETGKTVVLLNLENLYESLYDALNQYYVYLGGQRFVDLGLGTHRVKCRVHKDFRLIVVAEKQVVYKKFPIPLINRLEKHFLAMTTMLDDRQLKVLSELKKWARDFAEPDTPAMLTRGQHLTERDVFIGYHDDTAASLVLQVTRAKEAGREEEEEENEEEWAGKILCGAKTLLLQCATPESVIRLRNTRLRQEENHLADCYFNQQRHASLVEFLYYELRKKHMPQQPDERFLQVTTHSKLLSDADVKCIEQTLDMSRNSISHIHLQAFATEQQFSRQIRLFVNADSSRERLLLLQCDSGDQHSELIACARHNIENEYNQTTVSSQRRHIVFVIQLPRIAGGCFTGFQGGQWTSCHVDDLQPQQDNIPSLLTLTEHSISSLFCHAIGEQLLEDSEILSHFTSLGLDTSDSPPEDGSHQIMDVGATMPSHQRESADNLMERTMVVRDTEAGGVVQRQVSLDVDGLIQQCVHAAGAILKDPDALTERKTERVQLLLQLMRQQQSADTDLSFMGVMRKRIYLVLKDKEKAVMAGDMAKRWLSNEAASVTAVNKAGTFRQAIRQNLEAKIMPMLAAIVSLADVNAGMDVLSTHDSSRPRWVRTMFLRMLNDPLIVTLTYADIQSSAVQKVELSEMAVRTTGCDGAVFRAELPFSWIIKNQVDVLVHQTQRMPDEANLETLVCKLLSKSPLGKILESVEQEDKEGLAYLYLNDFIHMVYKPTSDNPQIELELIRQAITSAAREAYERSDPGAQGDGPSFELTIPGIHLIDSSIQQRLQLFGEAVRLWPACVVKLDELTKKLDSRITDNEMTLDVQALLVLLESLTPSGERLNDVKLRDEWLKNVQCFRPLVEQVLSTVDSKSDEYGDHSLQLSHACRRVWTRVSAVQLFVSHVCPVTVDKKILGIKRCMPLWKLLEKCEDFKKLRALEQVEKFLTIANKEAKKSFFGKVEDCKECTEPMDSPVQLPCGHMICDSCIVRLNNEERRKCPDCKMSWEETDDLSKVEQNEATGRYIGYKERCNMFFMELVSSLCFEGDTPPEADTVRRLLEYVTCQPEAETDRRLTKPMTVLRCIDPTPVVRSLLLQLLLRSEVEAVKDHLQQYFDQAREVLQQGSQQDSQQVIELCMMFVQCLEDSYHNKASRLVESETELLTLARESMNIAKQKLTVRGLRVDKLEAIALTRFGLAVTATWMEKVHVQRQPCSHMIRRMFDAAGQLCDQQLRWPRLFLMRQLSRRFGLGCLHKVGEVPHLRWVIPREARQRENDGIPDRFIVAGEHYKVIREVITRVVLGEDTQLMEEELQKAPQNEATERSLLLALYTEVTVPNASRDTTRVAPPEVLAKFGTFCTNSTYITHKDLADKMLTNRLGGPNVHLTMSPNHNANQLTLASMVTHFKVVMTCVRDNQLLQPLLSLITNPLQMQNAYLPAMPHDATEEVRQALLDARNRGGDHNPVLWRCPNGHPYVIGDCGRPAAVGRCTVCRAEIGGMGHTAIAGNQPLQVEDRVTGHRLGAAQQLPTQAVPERELSPAQTSVLRLLTHMALYLGANNNTQLQHIADIIKPHIPPERVSQFLWDHICHDTQVLVSAVGKSVDDCALLMNLLLCELMTLPQGRAFRGDVRLQTNDARQTWESTFTGAYITPLLAGLNGHLQRANTQIVNDERLGNNALMRELYETETPPLVMRDLQQVETTPAMWCHRTRVTIEHLTHELNEKSQDSPQGAAPGGHDKQHQILQMFLHEEHQLRALRFLPSVVKLQRVLLERYQRKIARAEANNLKVSDFLESLQDDHAKEEHMTLVSHFGQAWNLLRAAIAKVGFGGIQVPREFCEETVTRDTSLAMLLPAVKGLGVCSFALLQYLATMQNNFMEEYSRLTRQSCEECVSVRNVTRAHLISYHPERDLLPVVLSCCQYSLHVGKGSAVTYDFVTLQRQIEDRFLRNRPRLDPQVDLMAFREDFSSASIFANLDKLIPQEPLGLHEQHRIRNEMQDLTDMTNSLANLDIAIGFLVSVGGEPESRLMTFMKDTLEMKANSIHSAQARQLCHLKHVKSLWLLLSHERAKQLTRHGQDAFDNIDDVFRVPLPADQRQQLDAMLRHIRVESLLSALYECSLLHITVKQDTNAEDYADNQDQPLGYLVDTYLDATNAPPIPVLTEERFPATILAKHCLDTWRHILLHASRLQYSM